MAKETNKILRKTLPGLFRSIDELVAGFRNRKPFTIDGRLVGDIGEVLASEIFDLKLNHKLRKGYDGVTPDGRNVEVKATFKESLAFRTIPDYCIGFKLYRDGSYEVIFNGPGKVILQKYSHRDGIGIKQLSFPLSDLKALSDSVSSKDRIPRRVVKGG